VQVLIFGGSQLQDKMKVMNLLLMTYASLIFTSCENVEISTKHDSLPEIFWRARLGPELFDIIPKDPYIYKNKIIFGYQMRSGNEGYYIYDKNTGAVLKDIPSQASFDAVSIGYENLYFSKIGVNIRTIDMDNYEVKARKLVNPDWTFPPLSINDGSVFFPKIGRADGIPNVNNYEYIQCDLKNNMKECVFFSGNFKEDTSVLGTSVKYLCFETDKSKDKITYHSAISSYWKVGAKSRYKVVAFNKTRNKILWETLEFQLPGDDNGYVGDFKPLIYNNTLIIGLGGTHIYGFDIETGQEKWLNQVDNFGVNMIEYNGKLTFISMQGDMYLIDARSGAIIKKSSVGPANIYNFSLHKGVLYFSTVLNKLFAVNADTHEILWETKPPNSCSYCNYGFKYTIVDPETDRLYISDGKEVICYQLK